MKILYLTSSFPYPPHGGGALRVMGLLQGATQAGHELHLLSLGQAEHTPLHELCHSVEIVPPLQRSKLDRLATLLLSQQPDMQERSWNPAFLQALEAILAKTNFEIVQFESLEMGVYLPHVRRMQPSAKLIYDAYNAEADLQRMVFKNDRRRVQTLPLAGYSYLQWRRLRRYEQTLCQAADGVLAVSEADQKILRSLAGETPVWVVNNGIDVTEHTVKPNTDLKLQQPSVVFTGTMDYRPNVDAALWFANEVFPKLEGVYLYIVGNRPTAKIQALAKRPNIIVTGFVEDVLPYLHQATVFIVPLRVGSGTRLKLLQAMAAGCAIVSTHVGAMGLEVTSGREMLLTDSPPAFGGAIEMLLRDQTKWLELTENAQTFVRQKFDWAVIIPKLLAVYEEITAQG